jgi:hypothetical protein
MNIEVNTLGRWRRKWRLDNTYRPWERRPHLWFTTEEERRVNDFVLEQVVAGRPMTYERVRRQFQSIWEEKKAAAAERGQPLLLNFVGSNHFVQDWMGRWNWVCRVARTKRRPNPSDEEQAGFRDEIDELLRTVRHERILNMDETDMRLFCAGRLQFAQRGADEVNKFIIDGNDKQRFTGIASMTASFEKLPLWVIAQGTTTRCEKGYGTREDVVIDHSESGWTTETVMIDYLDWLRQWYDDDEPIHLILDCFAAHRAPWVKVIAAALNIVLHFAVRGPRSDLAREAREGRAEVGGRSPRGSGPHAPSHGAGMQAPDPRRQCA